MTTYIDAETMRHRVTSEWTPTGRVPGTAYDIRGTPIGDKAEVWEWDRMVYPGRQQKGRRVREYITVMHCPEGWYSTSGTADQADPALCSTLMDRQWATSRGGFDRDKYDAHHDANPVVWVIKVKRHTTVNVYRYCEPELPAEFRPQLTID